jgi:multiple antibiotic resistance protein
MLEITGIALATFFSTIGPLDVAAVFAALTTSATPAERRSYAIRGILIASVILGVFALSGDFLLAGFGISMAALRTAGGVLLLLIGIDLVFARTSGAITTTSEEIDEARFIGFWG